MALMGTPFDASRLPLKRGSTGQFTDSAEPRVYSRQAAQARTGQASTSATPPTALARTAVAAPYRWNTPPNATPPARAANPVMPWYAPNPLPWRAPASRATSARSGLSVSPDTRPSARNSPHAAAAVPARATPAASSAYTGPPAHIVRAGPTPPVPAPPPKLLDEPTTCTTAPTNGAPANPPPSA